VQVRQNNAAAKSAIHSFLSKANGSSLDLRFTADHR
jgi:hypothetical protein